ncbi:MAG: hypothetical protein CME65_11910 [Halobacteriovoraceae bacterium]|nr:hypothetical protein [Halobacteriovoraceae bacterium]|tara:strand:- start:3165 stop:3671 length:507 start_codon:yes stop_codon:yes gene_type:complete
MKILILCIFVIIVSCDKGSKTPEGLVKKFVEEATSTKLDMEFFEENTADPLLDSVKKLEPEEFQELLTISRSKLSKVKKPKIEISNKVCAGDKCTLTYIVKYDYETKTDGTFESEVKKVATVVKDKEFWKVSEVSNVKTYYNAQKPIDTGDPSTIPSDEESTDSDLSE